MELVKATKFLSDEQELMLRITLDVSLDGIIDCRRIVGEAEYKAIIGEEMTKVLYKSWLLTSKDVALQDGEVLIENEGDGNGTR